MKYLRLTIAILVVVMISMTASTCFTPVTEVSAMGRTVDSPMPSFENRLETDHFVLKWTNRSSHAEDNISDQQVIKDTGDYLEIARAKYLALFGRTPYVPPGRRNRSGLSGHGLLWSFRSSKRTHPVQF